MSELIKMAWRNLWRSRRRTLITLAAGGLGLMFAQGYMNWALGIYSQMIDDGVRSASGHVALYARGYLESREAGLTFPAGDLPQRIRALDGVRGVLPRLYLQGLAQAARGSRGVVILGVDPPAEWAFNPFARTLREGRLIDGRVLREAVIGRELLESLKLKVGGKFVVMAQGAPGEIQSEMLRVAGVLETGMKEIDARTVIVSLPMAGLLSGREGRVHEMAVTLADQRLIPAVTGRIRGLLPAGTPAEVVSWEKAMPDLSSHIRTDLFTLKIIIAFIYLIVGIGVVNTLLMSVLERSREFGVMMALGVPTRFLLGLILTEGLFMGLLAAVIGSLLGSGVTAALAHWGVDVRLLYRIEKIEVSGVVISGVLKARWAVPTMIRLAVTVLFIYPLAACYPAWRVTRVRPVQTMKYT